MPTGTQPEPDDFSKALMTVIRLKMAMTEKSKADIARLTDIPRATLSRILNDQRIPNITQVRMIAEALEIPLSNLITYAEGVVEGGEPPVQELYRGVSPKKAYQDQEAAEYDPFDHETLANEPV
jgi:transcriptional regulator with XRE-family HTH domain